ncbi:MAG: trypsin-like peptidase domain-containing protein [Polyangiaceae bacterium]|nr:trypsin-like peptidase domain-containing protein [Polyangiaceae bacterium]
MITRRLQRHLGTALLAGLSLGAAACGNKGGAAGAPSASAVASAAPLPTALPASTVVLPSGIAAPATFADIAAKADPAVVFVKTLQESRGARRMVGQGLGSGFVYDPDGLILTNNHVVANAADIQVTFAQDGRELKASVVGRDPPTDIAVLRVDAKGLSALPLGDSDKTRVGDWVLAIGNPFGLSHTVSAGIVSAKGRTRDDVKGLDSSGYYNFLQTDASINPGNSGGPLLDSAGQVVGINTAIRARANNIGFAIPINMVRELVPRLLKDGRVNRSAIGIIVASVNVEDVSRLGLAGRTGALVREVKPGSAGDRAGLADDDVILEFDGKPIAGPERLRWLASVAGVGSVVSLKVARGKRQFDLKLTLGELPNQAEPEPEPDFFDMP